MCFPRSRPTRFKHKELTLLFLGLPHASHPSSRPRSKLASKFYLFILSPPLLAWGVVGQTYTHATPNGHAGSVLSLNPVTDPAFSNFPFSAN